MMIRRTAKKPIELFQVPQSIYVTGENGYRYKVEIRNGIDLEVGDVIAFKHIEPVSNGYMYIGNIVIDKDSFAVKPSMMPDSDYAFVYVKLSSIGFWISEDTNNPVDLTKEIRRMTCIGGFDSRTREESQSYIIVQKDVLHLQRQMEKRT